MFTWVADDNSFLSACGTMRISMGCGGLQRDFEVLPEKATGFEHSDGWLCVKTFQNASLQEAVEYAKVYAKRPLI